MPAIQASTMRKTSVFLRFDATTQRLQLLAKATLLPANSRWLKDFSLCKGMKDFASYELLDLPLSQGKRNIEMITCDTYSSFTIHYFKICIKYNNI